MKKIDTVGAERLEVVAFDGHDLVMQVTCQSGKDALGRPHIEVGSWPVKSDQVDQSRSEAANAFARKGWRIREGKLACPTCARRLALAGV